MLDALFYRLELFMRAAQIGLAGYAIDGWSIAHTGEVEVELDSISSFCLNAAQA